MRELAELDGGQCIDLLGTMQVGRVAVCTPMGPRIVPVNFTLYNGDIWFRTTPYSELGTYGRNTEIAFEVDEINQENKTGASVVAFGRAEAVDDHDELSGLLAEDNPQPWARGQRHLYIRLRIRDISGRRIAR